MHESDGSTVVDELKTKGAASRTLMSRRSTSPTPVADVKAKNPAEPEFHQAVQEVAESVALVLEKHPEYRRAKIFERIVEPERVIMFRVPWMDDQGRCASTAASASR